MGSKWSKPNIVHRVSQIGINWQTHKPKIYPFIIIDITPTLMMMLTLWSSSSFWRNQSFTMKSVVISNLSWSGKHPISICLCQKIRILDTVYFIKIQGCIFFCLTPPPGGGGQKYGQISCWGKKWLKGDEKRGENAYFFPIGKKYVYLSPIDTKIQFTPLPTDQLITQITQWTKATVSIHTYVRFQISGVLDEKY